MLICLIAVKKGKKSFRESNFLVKKKIRIYLDIYISILRSLRVSKVKILVQNDNSFTGLSRLF